MGAFLSRSAEAPCGDQSDMFYKRLKSSLKPAFGSNRIKRIDVDILI